MEYETGIIKAVGNCINNVIGNPIALKHCRKLEIETNQKTNNLSSIGSNSQNYQLEVHYMLKYIEVFFYTTQTRRTLQLYNTVLLMLMFICTQQSALGQ